MSFRSDILSGIRDRVEDRFDVTNGSDLKLFRSVWRRAWRPGNKVRPACTVVDRGQRNAGRDDPDASKDVLLSYHLMIDLKEQWDRQTPYEDWSDNVQGIIEALQNWLPVGCGVVTHDYVDDDPWEVELAHGAREEVWLIAMEVGYILDVEGRDRT